MSERYTLGYLDAELLTLKAKDGTEWPFLLFECPICSDGHSHGIAFHDGPVLHREREPRIVWSREGGSTIEDLTLSPSYKTGCLHAHVRAGHLEVL